VWQVNSNEKMKNVLFITWDGPQTSYMEGLFMPIFDHIQKQNEYRFHVIQFTWGTPERISITNKKAEELSIPYTAKKIYRKPNSTVGSLITLLDAVPFLKKYIRSHAIDIVMPRSIMPLIMVNRLKKKGFKILYDADGLPIEERVDFSGLSKKSFLYNFFKKEEYAMLLKADTVITRTKKAIKFHLNTIGTKFDGKFFVVVNGRDTKFFKHDASQNHLTREELNLKNDTKVFIYSGSLGHQYGLDTMIKIFKRYLEINHNSVFLILTGNVDFAEKRIPASLQNHIIVRSHPFQEIPKYLSIGDIAFAIREPKLSMRGVAPIKLGEYLLMGIPTIASPEIGDTEDILLENTNCLLFNHDSGQKIEKALQFIENSTELDRKQLRKLGKSYFSMNSSTASYNLALDHCS
jgi:glycosyltransferase involved in cell wall biosynthesis